MPPVMLNKVEGQVAVIRAHVGTTLLPGEAIVSVEERPVEERLAEQISASAIPPRGDESARPAGVAARPAWHDRDRQRARHKWRGSARDAASRVPAGILARTSHFLSPIE